MKKSFRTLVVLLTVAGVCFTTSCSKKAAVNGKVKSETSTTTGGTAVTTTYTYDSQGRVISIQDNSGTETYSYSQSNVTKTSVSGQVTIYTLNNQGYAGSNNVGATYTYDNNGYLNGISVTGVGSESITISNGDAVSATVITTGTITYLYTFLSNVDYRDFGQSFLGKSNTHVINSYTVTSGSNSTTYTFSYNFDSEGRVLTQTKTGNGQITTTTYTY
jgi:YD repeat-containing protein